MFLEDKAAGRLIYRYDSEQLWVEPWGNNAVRVRATKIHTMPADDWALLGKPKIGSHASVSIGADKATLKNGKITVTVSKAGKLVITNQKGEILLEEYSRNRRDLVDPKCSALEVEAREFKPILGGDYHVTMRFESDPDEKLMGMGQYQQPRLNLKGQDIELAHRNSQASVPFALSSLGYGILINNPAIGRAVFGLNITSFEAYSTQAMDYWVVAGDEPKEIVEAYADATGKVPMMPEYGLGFWQCKLRYQTQEELLGVAREYKRRQLPIDLIVIDFFHWPLQGEWKFDPTYWPDPDAMVKELTEMGIELMVSIWPTVDKRSENYAEMVEKGLLIRVDRGIRTAMDFQGDTVHFDPTFKDGRDYIWGKAKQNYFDKGIKTFWLDEAEPEYTVYSFDNYRYHRGPNMQIGNLYPREYSRAFYEGQTEAGQKNIVNLVRCAWAGSQRYGALVWSGDIASSWGSFRNQLTAGLSMGIAGIPWFTHDIGGFHGATITDPAFHELLVRWFQWGAFSPVMRLHGDREPHKKQHGTTGGATCLSGADNEVWSYGEEVYGICKKYLQIREELRDYTRSLMREAHERGSPVMRTLFYEFPQDPRCWEFGGANSTYMYGAKYLVCPVLQADQRKMTVYLPKGARWQLWRKEGKMYDGGQEVEVACPIDEMPVFERM